MKKTIATFAMCIAGALAALLCAQEAPAPARVVVPLSSAKRACTFARGARSVFYERLYVVAKKEVPAGEPDEWWGIFPDRKQSRDANGLLRAVNVPAAEVLFTDPHDGPLFSGSCKCPPGMWTGIPATSAVQ